MCCRYFMELSPELRPYIEAVSKSSLSSKLVSVLGKSLITNGEVFPSNIVPVIAPDKSGKQTVFPMVWGFNVKGINRPIVNARSETANLKQSFKDAWKSHRCVIPASWYYEWEHIPVSPGKYKTGTKYAIQPAGYNITYLAGLYQIEEYRGLNYPVFTILTKEPSDSVKKLHDRMPVILPEHVISDWICPDNKAEDIIPMAINEVIVEIA